MIILPVTYLGSVDWFARLAGGDCIVDVGENWVKQTARNRAEIMTAGGVAALTVPVHGGNAHGGNSGAKIPVKDVRIDNTKRWQHTHWQSIVSAYRNSPFFDHYEERFAPFYEKKFDFLVDLNLELLDTLASVLRLPGGVVKISRDWVAAEPGDIDLRGKKALRRVAGATCNAAHSPAFGQSENRAFREYTQVFSERMAFIPGLSVIDLLFCEGPSARELLQ